VVDDLGLLEEGLARAVLPDTVAGLGLMYDFERLWYREIYNCPSSYKVGHHSGLSIGGSGSFLWLIMRLVFRDASGVVRLSVS